MHSGKLMVNEEINITIPQEVKEDYEYIKSVVENSKYQMNWNQVLEMLNRHIKQNFPEVSFLSKKYIDCFIYTACSYNDLKLASWLIRNGASINFQECESGNTLLHLTALNGNLELAELLVASGAHLGYIHSDIKTNLQGNTYLHLAAEKGLIESIKLLLKRKANTKIMTNYKKTALHLAIENSYYDCVMLLEHVLKGKKKEMR